jgi:hypothetical protein
VPTSKYEGHSDNAATVSTPVSEAQSRVPFSQNSVLDHLGISLLPLTKSVHFVVTSTKLTSPLSRSMLSNLLSFANFFFTCDRYFRTRPPPANKSQNAIIDAWRVYFDDLKRELAVSLSGFTSLRAILFITPQDVPGRISFTADIWSNQSRYPYLVVTAHWIAEGQIYPPPAATSSIDSISPFAG